MSVLTVEALNKENVKPDYTAIKTKQQGIWGSGDYGRIGITVQITGEQLCESMNLHAGESVLDIAAGNGNATLAAARRFCRVTSTDYVTTLLDQSDQRAKAEGLVVEYQHADAENLPFADAKFDNVVSTFGVMFAPDQNTSAVEMIRVCKSGGKIGLASWTPTSFIGQLLKTIGQYVAPPKHVQSPSKWGTVDFIDQHFKPYCTRIEVETKVFNFRYHSPEHWLDLFRTYYGPVHKAFATLDASTAKNLSEDIFALIEKFNRADDGTVVIASDYLEVVAIKK